jgi:hypothetical protein
MNINIEAILFKSKNDNEKIFISSKLNFIIIENLNKINTKTYTDIFSVPENILKSSLKEDEPSKDWKYNYCQINNKKYCWNFKNEVGRISNYILAGIEGDCWLRQINDSLTEISIDNRYIYGNKRLNDPNLLLAKDEFLFKLPEGLAQYPINGSLNISGQWDLISNVNQWKKEMKEMSSKW